jgi:U3 small nucleolar RNA-associated protein 14
MPYPTKSLADLILETQRLKEEAQRLLERSSKIDGEILKRVQDRTDRTNRHNRDRQNGS